MNVHQIIFRLDFQRVNTAIMDRPGRVIEVLESGGHDFWTEYQDNSSARSIGALFRPENKSLRRQFNVEPRSIDFVIEHAAGIPVAAIEEHDLYGSMMVLTHNVCEAFNVSQIQRAGLRVKVLSHTGRDGIKTAFSKLYSAPLVEAVAGIVGTPNDYAVAIDGKAQDGLFYHCRCGPYDDRD